MVILEGLFLAGAVCKPGFNDAIGNPAVNRPVTLYNIRLAISDLFGVSELVTSLRAAVCSQSV
jgi:hypothetical protein